jgi:hypothetical protein
MDAHGLETDSAHVGCKGHSLLLSHLWPKVGSLVHGDVHMTELLTRVACACAVNKGRMDEVKGGD